MTRFDTFVMVDWSGGNDRGKAPKKDAIWAAVVRGGVAEDPVYLRNRQVAEDWLHRFFAVELSAGRRVMAGFDFPFGYPRGFARAVTGQDDPLVLWDWFAERIEDAPKANNRFDVAAEINRLLGGKGPFWMNGLQRDIDGLPRTKADYANPFAERREVETRAKGAFTCWQLAGAGAVGSQVFMGLPVLARLRRAFAGQVAVWPFEPLETPIALVEIWPSLTVTDAPTGVIKDAHQVASVAGWLAGMAPDRLAGLLDVSAPEEGWILGVPPDGRAVPLQPPPLRNDCFALPAGVDWTPVDAALAMLRDRLNPVVAQDSVPLMQAAGRVLAQDLTARRPNPPEANTAVDGYAFHSSLLGPDTLRLPLAVGRSAAGKPNAGRVPEGHCLRVLTGAALPEGTDTVVLDEDVRADASEVAFRGTLKPGANTRKAGEDVAAGEVALGQGRVLTPADLALAAAVGHGQVPVYERLRVAVLSTGDELREAGETAAPGQIFDANRPMLLSMLDRWGHAAQDMGRVPDDRAALRARLDAAAEGADVILTSGGASAGDEDHVSALLRDAGAMQEWRIALKPGRPLALGLWRGKPVFGLPGNPVAALVCTLIFARPAMALLSGAGWSAPQGFDLPAAFEKRKKPGRREYLRARVRDGRAEVFRSEGSGRISGLSWAEGLVELGDEERHVRPGNPVRYLPFASFGL
ncbi:gephyrin-like molybdotransferase Glp [Thalassococcus sp. BH17M4-6]|uniref:molybdopterin-binding protein n=1 Tax=Thalassococcus sp. BH17M4-6 TaxID=3413148 RepID=UPI003BC9A8AB